MQVESVYCFTAPWSPQSLALMLDPSIVAAMQIPLGKVPPILALLAQQ